MKLRVTLLLLFGLSAAPATADFLSTNPGDPYTSKPAQPVPLDSRGWRDILTPQQCPNGTLAALNTCGDGRDGFVWGWDSFSSKMELRPPKILYGPGAVTSSGVLTQNAWNNLYGSVGSSGFRGGLTAYIPRGNYMGFGQVAVASGTVSSSTYTVRVLMGSCLQVSGSQQGILIIPQIATNAGTTTSSNVLNFAATTCITAGMIAYDVTHPAAITASNAIVQSVTGTTALLASNVASPGISSGDTIMFAFVSGYGGPLAWPGGSSLAFTIPYFFTTAAFACNAALNSNQQCEMLTQIYTTDSGAVQLAAGGQVTNPPYSTSFNIMRVDGGYGGQ